MKILERARADGVDAPVIPMALTNLWGSYFSRVERRASRWPWCGRSAGACSAGWG
jgi:hypothetical protein